MKDHRRQQEAYALGAPIDSSRKTSSLSREMEIQVQLEQMIEDIAGNTTDGLLGYAREDSIPDFLEYSGSDPCGSIYRSSQPISSLAPKSFLQATIIAPPTVHAVPATAEKSIFIESTMLLK